jgi:PAS domain S-box-containing protein
VKLDLEVRSPLLGCGPIHVLAWREAPGRPLSEGADWLANRFGGATAEASGLLDAYLDPVSREQLAAALGEHSVTGAVCTDVGELRFLGPDGLEAWFHLTVLRGADVGRHADCLATAVDVSAAKRIERELAEKSTRLELVLDGTRLGMWDWNPTTNEVTFNERWAEMLGHTLAEIEPSVESWLTRVHPDDVEPTLAEVKAHIEGRTSFYESVHRMRHKDGSWVYILDRGKIVERDAEGRVTRFSGTHTDITLQKEAELRAQEAAVAKSLFLATMSHEIRTPLNGILGLLQVLDGMDLSNKQRELLSLLTQSGEHLLVIINDILDLSKIEAGQLRLDPHPFHVPSLIDAVLGLYAERASAKHLRIVAHVAPAASRWVQADSHRLHQILGNLLSNAIKFTESGSVTVTVDAEVASSGLRLALRVTDTGRGIRDVEGIWERFRQEDASIARSYGGTGLGLSICRALTELLGGTIAVESELGRGTTFTVTVPVDEHDRTSAIQEQRGGADDGPVPTLSILVAEDNPVNRRVAAGMLDRLGQSAEFAVDGRDAVERATHDDFDLVLMDIHMPELDGIEAARQIIKQLGARAPRIVALSADVLETNHRDCTSAGFDGFLSKPFRLNELEAVLRETARARRLAA